MVIATGITADGEREILGVDIGDSEDETFWFQFLRSMRKRGLTGVRLVISDAHEGLKAAIRKGLSGASWQRCRVHYARNLLAKVPKGHQEMVAAAFRSIFALGTSRKCWLVGTRSPTCSNPSSRKPPSMRDAKTDVLAFRAFPRLIGARSGRTTRWND